MSILPLFPQSLFLFWLLKWSLLLWNSHSIHLRVSLGARPVLSCLSMLSLPYNKFPGMGSAWGAFFAPLTLLVRCLKHNEGENSQNSILCQRPSANPPPSPNSEELKSTTISPGPGNPHERGSPLWSLVLGFTWENPNLRLSTWFTGDKTIKKSKEVIIIKIWLLAASKGVCNLEEIGGEQCWQWSISWPWWWCHECLLYNHSFYCTFVLCAFPHV